MTLIVTQRKYSGSEVNLGTFEDLKDVYDYFGTAVYPYGKYTLGDRFSHDPMEYYIKEFKFHHSYNPDRWWSEEPVFCMVIQNHKGIRFSREYVKGMFRKFYKKEISKRRYRYNSIPGAKRHYRACYRRIRTFQERTMAVNIIAEDFEPKVRGSRNFHSLPNSWDDIPHFDVDNRNWKRFRKTQWKPKND